MAEILSHLQYVVAPMVSQSDAPFRALCLRYGATAAYTEMLYSDRIVDDPTYVDAFLPMCDNHIEGDIYPYSPLVVQICGNNPNIMEKAVIILASSNRKIAAIDLNLGCPQDRARDNLFGSFLLDKQHWENVFSCVKASATALRPHGIPFLCKIRLIEGHDIIELTTQFCRGLIDSGAKVICIHGRTRGSTKKRRCGPADLVAVATIARTLHEEYHGEIAVISNGNIITGHDVVQALRATDPCIGVMSAEGVLANPALYCHLTTQVDDYLRVDGEKENSDTDMAHIGADVTTEANSKRKRVNETVATKAVAPSLRELFQEYCSLSEKYKQLGGWCGLDTYCDAWYHKTTLSASTTSETTQSPVPQYNSNMESRQIYIARQHLNWMLGKSGHGRTVRYVHISPLYKKHVHLMAALNEAKDMDALLCIGNICLPENH